MAAAGIKLTGSGGLLLLAVWAALGAIAPVEMRTTADQYSSEPKMAQVANPAAPALLACALAAAAGGLSLLGWGLHDLNESEDEEDEAIEPEIEQPEAPPVPTTPVVSSPKTVIQTVARPVPGNVVPFPKQPAAAPPMPQNEWGNQLTEAEEDFSADLWSEGEEINEQQQPPQQQQQLQPQQQQQLQPQSAASDDDRANAQWGISYHGF